MGLFSKEPCAICGTKVRGLFNWCVEGQTICNDCYGWVDLPVDKGTNQMSLEQFCKYREWRDENAKLRQQFKKTDKFDFGLMDTKVMIDTENKLLCFDKNLNATIFEGSQIRSFVIREDGSLLFEGSAAGLKSYDSNVPERASELLPLINRYKLQKQLKDSTKNKNLEVENVDIPEPFDSFVLEIHFDHPYWETYTADKTGPRINNQNPDIGTYLSAYKTAAEEMRKLARALMKIAFDGAGEQSVDQYGFTHVTRAASTAPASGDVIAEIQKYKNLLDQGILTQEEFTAKKKQLLGI